MLGHVVKVGLVTAAGASLLTDLVLVIVKEFHIDTSELHNDSTSVNVSGVHRQTTPVPRPAAWP